MFVGLVQHHKDRQTNMGLEIEIIRLFATLAGNLHAVAFFLHYRYTILTLKDPEACKASIFR
jgi:hypothetical protein